MKKIIFLLHLFLLSTVLFSQKYAELAMTPPMGWNSWNYFGCNVSEDLIKATADAMVKTGMKDAGYEYIVIDDCWHDERDSLGFIHPNQERFPSGMKALADYIHSKGLKFGIYSDAGTKTCAGHPGSRGYEYQDALTYAKWGVDYLKYDWCFTGEQNAKESYKTIRDALYKGGRPIVLSLCEWGTNKPWEWADTIGHLWRTTGDIVDCWDCELGHGMWNSSGIMNILDKQVDLRKYAGPGHWNDPDMMEVGNDLTLSESRAHFTMWSMLAAPLIAGNDLRLMNQEITDILTNTEVIAVNQDPLGIQAYKMFDYGDLEIWVKPLQNDELAFCFLNRGDEAVKVDFDWKKHFINDDFSKRKVDFTKTSFNIRNIWMAKNEGTTDKIYSTTVPSHDVVLLKLTGK